MIRTKYLIGLAVLAVMITIACTTTHRFGGKPNFTRLPSGEMGVYEVPPGLEGRELLAYNHISEGADVYPYEWMLALKSAKFKDSNGNVTQPFLNDLDRKFGILRETEPNNPFLMNYIGLTGAWSSHPPESSDAARDTRASRRPIAPEIRDLNGLKSIRMVGTNCALCHTGAVKVNNTEYLIHGAPNMINVRGFFQDLALSTFTVLYKQEVNEAFLREFGVPNAEEVSKEFVKKFLRNFGRQTGRIPLGRVSGYLTLALAKKDFRQRFYKGSAAISTGLEELLKITYGLSDSDIENNIELKKRMEYLGKLMVGTHPQNRETPSGYARTDAFGRIGNLVLRGDNPIDYTAPISLPWIWGIKYQAMLHSTGNTNSVMLRNVGQAMGLGAVILDRESSKTTVNVHNLNRLEHYVHKIKVPNWNEIFKDQPNLLVDPSSSLVSKGKDVYEQNCAGCHTAKDERVGPAKALLDYKIYSLREVGTDSTAALNCVKPVDKVAFQDSIFAGVSGLKGKFYSDHNISPELQDEMEFRSIRGYEFFRDTYNGFNRQSEFNNDYGNIEPGKGYVARHLSGVWATAPYLHNGSVPNMWYLLQPATSRPVRFDVNKRDYDVSTLGYYHQRHRDKNGQPTPCAKNEEKCFDTNLVGNKNTGHEYGVDLSDYEKRALIEYLKVLPPENEYSW